MATAGDDFTVKVQNIRILFIFYLALAIIRRKLDRIKLEIGRNYGM